MKSSIAFHPLHKCSLNTTAAKRRHGLAHLVGMGDASGLAQRLGAVSLGRGAAHTTGKTSARAPTGAAERNMSDLQREQLRTGILANARAGSVTAAKLLHQLNGEATTIAPTPRLRKGTQGAAAARNATSSGATPTLERPGLAF